MRAARRGRIPAGKSFPDDFPHHSPRPSAPTNHPPGDGLADGKALLCVAVDTLGSSETPVDEQRRAAASPGRGAELRGLDSRPLVAPAPTDRIAVVARARKIAAQIGVTSRTGASASSAGGDTDGGLPWPGRYSQFRLELMKRRDRGALLDLIVASPFD